MSKNFRPEKALLSVVAAGAAALDWGSKAAAVRWLDEPVDLQIMRLRLVRNPGVAFGVGASAPAPVMLVIVSAVAAVVLLAAMRGALGGPIPAGLVAGGAVANVADRIQGGTVVDVFDLGWWPTFNLADSFIVIGAAMMILGSMRDSSVQATATSAADDRRRGQSEMSDR